MIFRLSNFYSIFSHSKQISYEFTVQKRYFDLIKEGKKTVEGRINLKKYEKIKIGDLVSFKNPETNKPSVLCIVKEKKIYLSFQEMLHVEGVENCLPGISSIDEALAIYHSFPGYQQKSQIDGVIAFKLQRN